LIGRELTVVLLVIVLFAQTFSQVEVCKQIVKHMTLKCTACPDEVRRVIVALQQQEQSQPAKRYPSRMVFFRRVWHRFHYGGNGAAAGGSSSSGTAASAAGANNSNTPDAMAPADIPWDRLVRDSPLVSMEEYGLVLDSQFAAMAQLDRCQLTAADQIGYNKGRTVGFVGLCCRYCGGRPGFGRFFPATERNLEKTSARDTIVSHISLFCREVPEDVRNALLSLKRIESSVDGSATMKKLIYGSGKLFFHRVWTRLHRVSEKEEEGSKKTKKGGALLMTKEETADDSKKPAATVTASEKEEEENTSSLSDKKAPPAAAAAADLKGTAAAADRGNEEREDSSSSGNDDDSSSSHSSTTESNNKNSMIVQNGGDDDDNKSSSSSEGSVLAPPAERSRDDNKKRKHDSSAGPIDGSSAAAANAPKKCKQVTLPTL